MNNVIDIGQRDRVASIKMLPHSIEAESSVLGGLLIDCRLWDKIAGKLSIKSFYKSENQIVFNAIRDMMIAGENVDFMTVQDRLKETENLARVGGFTYLMSLANNTPGTSNIEAYADIVRSKAILRGLISACNDTSNTCYSPGLNTVSDILDRAQQRVFKISEKAQSEQRQQHISEVGVKVMNQIEEYQKNPQAVRGISTGFKGLDQLTKGLKKDNLIILAARPAMGKTMLATNIAQNVAMNGEKSVMIFSMEMSSEEITTRIFCSLANISQDKLSSEKIPKNKWDDINKSFDAIKSKKLLIDDSPALTVMELRSRARAYAVSHGLDLIVVDYLQLMKSEGKIENRVLEVGEISRSLKALAKELHVPVLALSQLNRGVESREDKRPMMSDLRDSGAIEQDADLIFFIYRDEVYKETTNENKNMAEIILSKNRHGPTGMTKMTFLGHFVKFIDYIPPIRFGG